MGAILKDFLMPNISRSRLCIPQVLQDTFVSRYKFGDAYLLSLESAQRSSSILLFNSFVSAATVEKDSPEAGRPSVGRWASLESFALAS